MSGPKQSDSSFSTGKYMVDKSSVSVLGRPPFHDTVSMSVDASVTMVGGNRSESPTSWHLFL